LPWSIDAEPIISDDEVDEVCQAFGRILVLLDEIFACMNTERGGVSNEVKTKLTNRLELARVKWNELNFSSTPKWHVLLNHAANQLADMDGFADMGEDCIERNHQSREKDRHRHSRLRNPQQAKNSQARFQHIRMLDDVVGIQNKVREHSKRNLKRTIPLGVQREEQRKAKRVATRDENANYITNEPRLIMKTPKERTKQEYLQSLQEEE
jgi:lysyl-tRNA synthetase class I